MSIARDAILAAAGTFALFVLLRRIVQSLRSGEYRRRNGFGWTVVRDRTMDPVAFWFRLSVEMVAAAIFAAVLVVMAASWLRA